MMRDFRPQRQTRPDRAAQAKKKTQGVFVSPLRFG
jgi:hypothetical protein